jgi:hypothetical protein
MIGNRALLPGLWWLAQAGLAAANLSQSPLNLVIFAPSVAPGAIAQIRLTLATPYPISAGSVVFNFDPAVFGPPIAVDAFSATGDQNGQGNVTNNQVVASFSSSSGGIGSLPGVPAFIVTLPVLASAPAGATTSVSFLFGGTPWMNAAGNLYNPTVPAPSREVRPST